MFGEFLLVWLASLRERDALSSIISVLGLDGFIHLSATAGGRPFV